MINNISYVTKKLQRHSLDESTDKVKVTTEDRDSGTESDDATTLEEPEFTNEMSSDVSSGCSVRSRPTSQTSTDTLCDDIPGVEMPPPTTTVPAVRSRGVRTRAAHSYFLRTPELPKPSSPHPAESPIDALLDSAIMSDCDGLDPVEHHSSEEELEPLTSPWLSGPSEKRKWSQVARPSLTDSGSSDDEVCVITGTQAPVKFRTSPPLEAHKPMRSASPPSKMINFACHPKPEPKVTEFSSFRDRAPSPRKRHRHTPRPHRPSLDFEKMQQMKNRAVTQWRNGGELSLSFF